jgi:hypothetical protein
MAVLHEDMEIMGWAEDKVSQAKAMVNSVRNYIENDFGGTTSASTSTKWPMYKEHWNPGERAWFEYQCWESDESCDAELWKHTHQQVTIIGESDSDELCAVNSLDERIAGACMKVYNVRFDDGFEYEVVEDELFTDKKYWEREDYPADEDDNSGGATSAAAVKPWEEKRKPVHAFRDSSYDFGDFSCDECDSWERQWPLTRSTKHDVHCMSCGKPMLAKDAMDGECRSCYNEIEGSYTAIEKPTLTLASNRRSVAAALLAAADALSKGER